MNTLWPLTSQFSFVFISSSCTSISLPGNHGGERCPTLFRRASRLGLLWPRSDTRTLEAGVPTASPGRPLLHSRLRLRPPHRRRQRPTTLPRAAAAATAATHAATGRQTASHTQHPHSWTSRWRGDAGGFRDGRWRREGVQEGPTMALGLQQSAGVMRRTLARVSSAVQEDFQAMAARQARLRRSASLTNRKFRLSV